MALVNNEREYDWLFGAVVTLFVDQRSNCTSIPDSTGMADRLRAICNQPTRSTQPYIPLGSLNQVPAIIGCQRRECQLCRVAGNTV